MSGALDLDHPHFVDWAVGHHRIAVAIDIHIPNDVAAARDRPRLKLLHLRVELMKTEGTSTPA
jgi:hypothetical protein